jgi:hypothetical protein
MSKIYVAQLRAMKDMGYEKERKNRRSHYLDECRKYIVNTALAGKSLYKAYCPPDIVFDVEKELRLGFPDSKISVQIPIPSDPHPAHYIIVDWS